MLPSCERHACTLLLWCNIFVSRMNVFAACLDNSHYMHIWSCTMCTLASCIRNYACQWHELVAKSNAMPHNNTHSQARSLWCIHCATIVCHHGECSLTYMMVLGRWCCTSNCMKLECILEQEGKVLCVRILFSAWNGCMFMSSYLYRSPHMPGPLIVTLIHSL